LQRIIAVATYFDNNGDPTKANLLTNLALKLGEWLWSDLQPTALREKIADILFDWGIQQHNISNFVFAVHCWQQCLIIYQEIQDRKGEISSLGNLGNAYQCLGQYEKAIVFHEQCLEISRKIKNRHGEAFSLGNLGSAYYSLGQYEKAIVFHEQCLAISREIKDRQGESISLGNLGNTYRFLGQYEKAIIFQEQSLSINMEPKIAKEKRFLWAV